jgi:hypothetical protein
MTIYEVLFRFLSTGDVSGIASRQATFVNGSATNIGIAQTMDFGQFAAALTDADLNALGAAIEAEINARNA